MGARRASEGVQALAGLAFVVVLAAAVLLPVMYGAGAFANTFSVTTRVASVGGGLPVGSDVKLRGLTVGRVAAVDVTRTQADVTLDLDPELAKQVPASVETRILPASIFGVPFVDLEPMGAESPAVRAGAVIRSDTSAQADQLAHIYDTVVDLLNAIQPAKLDSALTAIASALQGNGRAIGQLLGDSASYLSQITPNRDQLSKDIATLTNVVQRVDASAPDILATLNSATDLAKFVVEQRQQLVSFLSAGIDTATTGADLLNTSGPRVVRALHVGAPVFAALAADSSSARATLLAFGRVADAVNRTYAAHHDIMVSALATFRPFPTYSAADCPRYGALAGANCGSGGGAATSPTTYAGNVGAVGSSAQSSAITQLLGQAPSGLASLLAGPALQGATVVTP